MFFNFASYGYLGLLSLDKISDLLNENKEVVCSSNFLADDEDK